MWSRIHLIPLLQAEEDRDQVRRWYAQQALEKELLGAETKAYNSDRYGTPFCMMGTLTRFADWGQICAADVCGDAVACHEVEEGRGRLRDGTRRSLDHGGHCTYVVGQMPGVLGVGLLGGLQIAGNALYVYIYSRLIHERYLQGTRRFRGRIDVLTMAVPPRRCL